MSRINGGLLPAWILLLALACSGNSDSDAPSQTEPPSSESALLEPSDSELPAAGVCPGPSVAEPATIEFQPEIPYPRCLRILQSNHLRLVNQTDAAIHFEVGDFQGSLEAGDAAVSELTVGEFLAPGVHVIQSTAYARGGSGEIWILTEEMAQHVELVIHKADGTDETTYLLSEPVVCGSREGVVELCGEAIVNGQIIAVDFIQVNRVLGETYEVQER